MLFVTFTLLSLVAAALARRAHGRRVSDLSVLRLAEEEEQAEAAAAVQQQWAEYWQQLWEQIRIQL